MALALTQPFWLIGKQPQSIFHQTLNEARTRVRKGARSSTFHFEVHSIHCSLAASLVCTLFILKLTLFTAVPEVFASPRTTAKVVTR